MKFLPEVDSIGILLGCCLLVCSCSIKTDRSDCPCVLSIEMQDPLSKVEFALLRDGETRLEKTLEPENFSMGICKFDIVRGRYIFSIHEGCSSIEEGMQADSLYAWTSGDYLDANREELVISPQLGKQFATMYLEMVTQDESSDKFDLAVVGSVSGIDMAALTPLPGKFRYEPERKSDGLYTVRIPRQFPDGKGLQIILFDKERQLAVLPVSEYISYIGYDWTDFDLEDIYISINCEVTDFGMEVLDWKVGFYKAEVL